ncbi:MAG TPA: alpha/beta hydrolase [Streptosporangiaceae bacterium]|nr:alpha/beta hydrolase [Streptosporangiaceae bacterium]
MNDPVIRLLRDLVSDGVQSGELARDGRVLRWAEAGSGRPVVVFDAALGEPGTMAWAGVMALVAPNARAVAYDRAGIGASDPMSPLTLDGQLEDLAAVLEACGDGPCVVVGHSWGGLLAQLVAMRQPELVAGLVLVDPAEERYLSALPSDDLREGVRLGEAVMEQHAKGELAATIRSVFGDFATRLSEDSALQERILDTYVSCYAKQSQARMVLAENLLVIGSLPRIQRIRQATPLPDIPVVIFSATEDRPGGQRETWTGMHVELAASMQRAEHIVLADTSHAVNQERPGEVADAINRIVESVRREGD